MTDLKKQIVMKWQFRTQPKKHDLQPSQFIENYISRDTATEQLVIKNYAEFYQARSNATQQLINNAIVSETQLSSDLNWRSFGRDSLSYSRDELRQHAQRIDELFHDGHSVMFGVISFGHDLESLKELKIIDDDFQYPNGHTQNGQFRNHVDEARLRQAVNNGLRRLTSADQFSNPIWTAAVQLDTDDIHVHVVLADDVPLSQSKRLRKVDNCERGKIRQSALDAGRDGLYLQLIQNKDLHAYSKAMSADRQSLKQQLITVMIKQQLYQNRLQAIRDSLPDNKRLWRANSHAQSMQQAQQLTKQLVQDSLEDESLQPIYHHFVEQRNAYAKERQDKDEKATKRYADELLERQLMNSVYMYLRDVDKRSSSKDNLKKAQQKAKQYQSRLQQHEEQAKICSREYRDWLKTKQEHRLTAETYEFGDLWRDLALHHMQVGDSYRFYFNRLRIPNKRQKQTLKHEYDTLQSNYSSVNAWRYVYHAWATGALTAQEVMQWQQQVAQGERTVPRFHENGVIIDSTDCKPWLNLTERVHDLHDNLNDVKSDLRQRYERWYDRTMDKLQHWRDWADPSIKHRVDLVLDTDYPHTYERKYRNSRSLGVAQRHYTRDVENINK